MPLCLRTHSVSHRVRATAEYVLDHGAVLAFQHGDQRSSKQWNAGVTRDVSPT
ncbi:hypothetical protein SLI_5817 [Streptomyces lividans 1326]|uniref:Uncharacterized protein n=1 Tax=Streptomyces lividans 1326 TaxID=1200984 RepID=A0A7U9DXZ5_STRLI|nr:hypothetical protein SLI_5817 [Streptomyces lividans 1326]